MKSRYYCQTFLGKISQTTGLSFPFNILLKRM